MTRLSGKQIIQKQFSSTSSIPADFEKPEIDATLRDKGYEVIFEKAYMCPCKSKSSTHLSLCKNCGGTGWIFCNPTQTRFIITGIAADNKLKEAALREWGFIDGGVVNVTAMNDDKFSYMDKITVIDATAEHSQILYAAEDDEEEVFFAYSKYDILSVDYIALFVSANQPLKRLTEGTDYNFRDNVITFTQASGINVNSQLTIRYIHHPVFHIFDIMRESMTSTKGQLPTGQQKLILPIKALAKRAHLIKDVENFDGDRLLDNSWKPSACEQEQFTTFQRQLRYATAQTIYDNLTSAQISALDALIHS